MINHWWVTRPKRKLNTVPEILAVFADISLDQEWAGQRETHLSAEQALEDAGLKRSGERRDQTGGGARTYLAWLKSLGLVFEQNGTKKIKLTLAGEAIMAGKSPVKIIKNQIFKYQFPSSFSVGRGVDVSRRFKIRPFKFLLKLLRSSELEGFITQEEVAKIIITEAEKETDSCYKYIVNRILEFRNHGDACLPDDFAEKYASSKGSLSRLEMFDRLNDVANTIINWLEYTQLVKRDIGKVYPLKDKLEEIDSIINTNTSFIDREEEHEYFQRKYGIDPEHKKDTRNLTNSTSVTMIMLAEQKIKQAFINLSLQQPITKITANIIDKICDMTGISATIVEDTLQKYYGNGSVSAFMTNYFEMAFHGRDDATAFEKATVELFREVFGFETKHVGPIGLTPDVLLVSDSYGYQAIIDNKAYREYSISNDHRNRMVTNYIGGISNYSPSTNQLAYFTYIAGGFGSNINNQIQSIQQETGVNGSAITVGNMIDLVECYDEKGFNHGNLKDIFSVNRQILKSDFVKEIAQ